MTAPIEHFYRSLLRTGPLRQAGRLSIAFLRETLAYDPASGALHWLPRTPVTRGDKIYNGRYAGKVAGCLAAGETVVNIRVNGVNTGFRAHHLAWAIHTGNWPEHMIDHINGDCHNNKWCNLREATSSGNNANRHVVRGFSKYKGVSRFKGKWSASATHNKKQIWIGTFASERDAALAYDRTAQSLFGEFAKTNAQLGLL